MKKFDKPLYEGEEWTPALLQQMVEICDEVGEKECGLSLYPNEVKIVTPKQMEDAMVTGALPLQIYHWVYGLQSYKAQESGSERFLEVVQNTDPCQLYCAENNTATQMLTVIAHAGIGHNAVFKNNFLYKEFTHPRGIVDYLLFARDFLKKCEEKYGEERVSDLMTACMVLAPYSVDLMRKPKTRSYEDELVRLHKRVERFEQNFNPVFQDHSQSPLAQGDIQVKLPSSPDENILKFLEKNGPLLRVIDQWEAEVIRIFRKINEYFYPGHRTMVLHEGAACTMQWKVFSRLSPLELGVVDHRAMNSFFETHASVIAQPGHRWRPKFDGKVYAYPINHYSLGFQLFQDIERMCKEPTEEDKRWFPSLPGSDFWEVFRHIISQHDDESFIRTYLSPKLIRDYAFYVLKDDPEKDYYEVTDIHNEEGYRNIRDKLAQRYAYHDHLPNIAVANVDIADGCALTLQHRQHRGIRLDHDSASEVLYFVQKYLWRRNMSLESINSENFISESWRIEGGRLRHVDGSAIENDYGE